MVADHIMLAHAAKPTEVVAHITVVVLSDAQDHTAITGRVVMVAVIGDIMRNTLQRKKPSTI